MSLRLVIESSPHRQPVPEIRHQAGDLSIGRGADCDWQIDDPDMFISRRHCVVTARDGRYTVTDASRGGLFVDGADRALGAGNTAVIDHGTRLRMGDVVIRVEVEAEATPRAAAPSPRAQAAFGEDDFFSRRAEPAAPPRRPETLPEPFETARGRFGEPPREERRAPPPAFDDPFTLDAPAARHVQPEPTRPLAADISFGSFFDDTPSAEPAPPPRRDPPRAEPAPVPADIPHEPPPAAAQPAPRPQAPPPAQSGTGEAELRAAFFRGLGLDPATLPATADAADEMEALGRRFRLMAEGLVHLLRTRAKEKGSVRVAQTVIGAADVNPLKFLATTEDALAALVAARGRGYLAPDDAITASFRDLTDHQVRMWIAMQAALRRMIDRFDPAAFEAEADKAGAMKSLLAGGRSARLWQLYGERYREMAKAAEDRFLGEIGADFRDAYEGEGRRKDD